MVDYDKRAKEFRRKILDHTVKHGDAHLGGDFSEADILLALYDHVMKPEDKFILSKGHACTPLYVLLEENGHSPKIQGHPDIDEENGINCTTGSLGHGLPIGVGMALARKKLGKPGRIYVLMGDGECQEGTTWESALIAAHHKLDNLTAIVDRNNLQALKNIEDIVSLGDLGDKFKAFGWASYNIDGHYMPDLLVALKGKVKDYPRMIVAQTVKGKGVSYMEHDPKWHARMPNEQELKKAYEELKD
jgi:transketolase